MSTVRAGAAPSRRPLSAPAPRHLKVVDKRRRQLLGGVRTTQVYLVSAFLAAAAVLMALIYLHVVSAQRQFEVNKLNTNYEKAVATYQADRQTVSELNAPSVIIGGAKKLGMIYPGWTTIIQLSHGSAASTSPATPAGQAPDGASNWPSAKGLLGGNS